MQKIDIVKTGLIVNVRIARYKYNNAYSKARKLYDPEFKLLGNLRVRL